jgi:hypothetical protein
MADTLRRHRMFIAISVVHQRYSVRVRNDKRIVAICPRRLEIKIHIWQIWQPWS